jgi:hypothetical protein
MDGLGADFAFHHFVGDADVCKSAARHYEVVTSAGAVGVEILFVDAFGFEVSACGGVDRDVASGGDMIGCDGVAKNCENVGILYWGEFWELF